MAKHSFILLACLLLAQHAFSQEAKPKHDNLGLCSSDSDCNNDEECVIPVCVPEGLAEAMESLPPLPSMPPLPFPSMSEYPSTTPYPSISQYPSVVPYPSLTPYPSLSSSPSLGSSPSASPSGLQSPIVSGGDAFRSPTPSPSQATPSSSPSTSLPLVSTAMPVSNNSSVCVDAAYLIDLGHTANEFVHSSHILANTLCPSNGLPCGTANHMVRMNGESLSYEQLCERVVCTKKTTAVNSVFTHVWEDKMHGDVALTMYDVRHPEMMQRALHRVSQIVRKIVG